MKIICFDQSTSKTGFSIWNNKELSTYGLLEVNDVKNPMDRLCCMYLKIEKLIKETKPDFVFIEDIFYNKNFKTFQLLAQLQGMIFCCLMQFNVGYVIISPSAWKSYIGIKSRKRIEQKKETQIFVKEKYNVNVGEDEADSIGIGWYSINNLMGV